jgi:hypothetical protein
MREENQTKSGDREDSSLCPETSTENAVQEFHLRKPTIFYSTEKRTGYYKSGELHKAIRKIFLCNGNW